MPDLSIVLKEEEMIQVMTRLPEALREELARVLEEAVRLLLEEIR